MHGVSSGHDVIRARRLVGELEGYRYLGHFDSDVLILVFESNRMMSYSHILASSGWRGPERFVRPGIAPLRLNVRIIGDGSIGSIIPHFEERDRTTPLIRDDLQEEIAIEISTRLGIVRFRHSDFELEFDNEGIANAWV